jgi:restriction system protein
MKNPGFQEYFLILLQYLDKKPPQNRQDVVEAVANMKGLSEVVKAEMLPNQSQPTYVNRIGWAMTYLKKAGMLSTPSRSMWQITDLGTSVLNNPPKIFNVTYLKKTFDSFAEFHNSSKTNDDESSLIEKEIPPDESLVESFNLIKQNECDELISKILEQSPEFFEKLVVDLLLNMGYGGSRVDAGKAIGKSGDEGIDGTISEDRLGLDTIYVQAKRWKRDNIVGRPEIQKFVGSLSGQNARKGIFITTSRFTQEALNFKPKNDLTLVLIDGGKLADLMYEYSVGVNEVEKLVIKKIDNDYFEN